MPVPAQDALVAVNRSTGSELWRREPKRPEKYSYRVSGDAVVFLEDQGKPGDPALVEVIEAVAGSWRVGREAGAGVPSLSREGHPPRSRASVAVSWWPLRGPRLGGHARRHQARMGSAGPLDGGRGRGPRATRAAERHVSP
ncbi:hypothetical protein AB0H49_24790 [Nocardia sp. NPDC050713]|uniref:hypothetical protein n=1 Tax=Nocardia sp. NPDC050713 TaxID=3154511 RepID=UPI0033D50D7A